jgi:hypothetical protein
VQKFSERPCGLWIILGQGLGLELETLRLGLGPDSLGLKLEGWGIEYVSE